MNRVQKKSMLGTVIFLLAIVAVIASIATASIWLAGSALIMLVAGVVLLSQVGRSIS